MSPQYVFGQAQTPARKKGGKLTKPSDRRGVPDTGRIVKLLVGQGHGYIRLANDREIYFHRADIQEGVSFNDLVVGDRVTFERLDDPVSGDRALCVKRISREAR